MRVEFGEVGEVEVGIGINWGVNIRYRIAWKLGDRIKE